MAISPSLRGCRSSSPAQAQRRNTTSAAPTKTRDQAIRWARISIAPAGFSRGQKRGTSPHMPYAAKPFSRPIRPSPFDVPATGPSFSHQACVDEGNAERPRLSCPYRYTVMTDGAVPALPGVSP